MQGWSWWMEVLFLLCSVCVVNCGADVTGWGGRPPWCLERVWKKWSLLLMQLYFCAVQSAKQYFWVCTACILKGCTLRIPYVTSFQIKEASATLPKLFLHVTSSSVVLMCADRSALPFCAGFGKQQEQRMESFPKRWSLDPSPGRTVLKEFIFFQ